MIANQTITRKMIKTIAIISQSETTRKYSYYVIITIKKSWKNQNNILKSGKYDVAVNSLKDILF